MKVYIHAIIILLLLLNFGCNDETVKSRKTSLPPTIDGNLNDWDKENFSSFDDGKIKLCSLQDTNYIYFAGSISDKNTIKALTGGDFTFWINPSGSKDKDIEIRLRKRDLNVLNFNEGGFYALLSGNQKKNLVKNIDSLSRGLIVSDKKNNIIKNFLPGKDESFQAKIVSNDDIITFEIKIPVKISQFFSSYANINPNSMFCLESNGNMRPFLEQMNNRRGAGTGLMNGGQNMRRNGMGGGELGKGLNSLFNEIWLKIESDENK